jgi:hypothetical protein
VLNHRLATTHSTYTTIALPILGAAFTAAVLLGARHRMNPDTPRASQGEPL